MTENQNPSAIGFVGLGVMGRRMAANLLKAGFTLRVHDLVPAAVQEMVDAGAEQAASASALAERSAIVVTMLPDTPDVEAVLFGPQGLAGAMRPGSVLVDMSSICPLATRDFAARLAERGVEMLDAPVSGGYQGAEAGTLSIMVGGKAAVLERCRPLLEAMGRISHIGDAGAGQVCKVCNQTAVAITIQAVAESLTLARKCGVDPAKVREALLGGFAKSTALDLHGQRVLDGNFAAGFRVALQRKDLRLALEAGSATGTPLPATALIQQLYGVLAATGRNDLDNSSLALLMEEFAGLREPSA